MYCQADIVVSNVILIAILIVIMIGLCRLIADELKFGKRLKGYKNLLVENDHDRRRL